MRDIEGLRSTLPRLAELAIGGTAVGRVSTHHQSSGSVSQPSERRPVREVAAKTTSLTQDEIDRILDPSSPW